MNIGFDAKRAYHNDTGLGFYSRTLIQLLSSHYPQHEYYLFNPKKSNRYQFTAGNIHEMKPQSFPGNLLTSAWRSSWVTADLKKLKIDLYHGLSHEIPVGISKTGIPSVVTIHDLIHERYPHQYKPIDRKIYTKKYQYACRNASKVIAISGQTKQDLIDFYKVDPEKIVVCYMSCSPVYTKLANESERQAVRQKYKLPPAYFLSVGTINERKNLLNVCKAMFLLRHELQVPLVVIGRGKGSYYQQVKDFVLQNGLTDKIIFLSELPGRESISGFLSEEDMPAVYQQASALLYPSYFEGFGLPIMEALYSGLPVITSNVSCMPEVGGEAAYYVNPDSSEEIAIGMQSVFSNNELAATMRQKGFVQAAEFSAEKYVTSVMNVYKSVW